MNARLNKGTGALRLLVSSTEKENVKDMNPTKVHGTSRQRLIATDGSSIERSYIYLPSSVWAHLHAMARTSGTSVSQIIQSFANTGTAISKEPDAISPTNNAASN